MRKVVKLMLRQSDLTACIQFLGSLEKSNACYQAMKILGEAVEKDNSLPFKIGTSYTRALRLAASSPLAQAAERAQLISQAEDYEKKFSTIGSTSTSV